MWDVVSEKSMTKLMFTENNLNIQNYIMLILQWIKLQIGSLEYGTSRLNEGNNLKSDMTFAKEMANNSTNTTRIIVDAFMKIEKACYVM